MTRAAQDTQRVYGLLSALAVMKHRPEQVVRITHTSAVRGQLADALREAARRRIAYREVGEEELARIAGAEHHEGVCVLVRAEEPPSVATLAQRTEPSGLLLVLDDLSNPHNVGAVLRSAGFFGVKGLLVGDAKRRALPGAAIRIAEGGAEHVPVAHVAALDEALATLQQQDVQIIGAEGQAKLALSELRWPKRCALVLGNEEHGLSAAVRKRCDALVSIAGCGAIESLNVSVAAGILLASYHAASGQSAFSDRADRAGSRRQG